jgi:hypothetical protein
MKALNKISTGHPNLAKHASDPIQICDKSKNENIGRKSIGSSTSNKSSASTNSTNSQHSGMKVFKYGMGDGRKDVLKSNQ